MSQFSNHADEMDWEVEFEGEDFASEADSYDVTLELREHALVVAISGLKDLGVPVAAIELLVSGALTPRANRNDDAPTGPDPF